MFLSSGRINWIFLPKSLLTLMSILHEVAKSTVSKSEGKLPLMGEGARQEG